MKANNFIVEVVRPVLRHLGMWSPAAEKLLVMTACHESGGFRFREQQGGPALSFFQIEPATFYDIWDRYLEPRPGRKALVAQFLPEGVDPIEALRTDDRFACAIARMKYASLPDPLPSVADNQALAAYCKTHWNTALGKATPEKYLSDYERYGPQPEPEEWN